MRAPDHHHHHATHLFILSLFVSFIVPHRLTSFPDLISNQTIPRRLLHQPLFPATSAPPPEPPPPPPPPSSPNSDQPFFPEDPNNPDQTQPSPPPPSANGTTAAAVANPVSTQPIKPAKKVAIAISVGIVTLGMLSALAFYLYKHRVKHSGASQKLVGANSQRFHDESRLPPSSFLYVGTVEPTNESSVEEGTNGLVSSPYRKLGSAKRSDRYRPSPELQPLPPLPKPPLPIMNSPPPMSSSDEESRETEFYTPQCSLVSNDDGSSTPGSRRSWVAARGKAEGGATTTTTSTNYVPFAMRTSPKTRISFSPPNPKLTIIPSIKQTPPPPPPPPRIQSITNQPPPPPPPPPPPISTPRTLEGSEASVTSIPSQELRKLQSRIPNSKDNFEKARPEELNNGVDSSERTDGDDADGSKPRLKPLHWDKVRATSDRATVWDQLKSSSFQLNEDMMETLFGCNSTNSVPKASKEVTRKSVLPPVEHENRVLDPKKSQNIAILLRALNVTRDEVSEALLDGNPEGLGSDLLETLVKMAPTKEEEIKLRDYKGDISKLGSAERFLKTVLDIPFAFKRVEAMLYRANFDTEVKYLRKSFQTLEVASAELKNSRLFLKILEAVLRTGNRMNVGTNRGDATAFKLETLLKLVDIKGTDGKTTFLHFVVQEIIRSEGTGSDPTTESLPNKMNSKLKEEDFKNQGLQVVAGLSRELGNVKKAAGMDSDVLNSYVSKLETGLEKVRLVLQYEKPNMQGKFFESMKTFLKEADNEITGIKVDERMALLLVKEVTEYFHGNAVKEEAHPLRIFMIVRDFLSILDNVCKEVGRLQDNTMVGSARSFRIPPNASLPILNRYNVRHDASSDEESSSP